MTDMYIDDVEVRKIFDRLSELKNNRETISGLEEKIRESEDKEELCELETKLGYKYYLKNDFNGCAEHFANSLKYTDEKEKHVDFLISSILKPGKINESLKIFKKISKIEKYDEVEIGKANLYAIMEKYDKEEKIYNKLLKENPKNVKALERYMEFLIEHMRLDEIDELMEKYPQAFKILISERKGKGTVVFDNGGLAREEVDKEISSAGDELFIRENNRGQSIRPPDEKNRLNGII